MIEQLRYFLLWLTSILFLANLIHSFFYLRASAASTDESTNRKIYYPLFIAFFGAMVFSLLAPSITLMWVAIELTTLVSAPLIAFHRSKGSLEAMWKYLLICSIGIGLALFGTMIVLHAQSTGDLQWYKVGFVFVLAGYGTKMGLAPFHTWLPDAHSEAPAPVSAMLSGALLNCSFFAIARFRLLMPDEIDAFCDWSLVALGLLSLLTAAVFMVRQTDFKRLLAYSSVEHMGLIAILFALLGLNGFSDATERSPVNDILVDAIFVHIAAHSLTKTMMFQLAGNLLLAFKTRAIAAVQGLRTSMRGHSLLWTTGTLLICGMPPSLLFLTELCLVVAAPITLAAVVLVLLFAVFAAMTKISLGMTMGKVANRPQPIPHTLMVVPAFLFTFLVIAGIVFSLLETISSAM